MSCPLSETECSRTQALCGQLYTVFLTPIPVSRLPYLPIFQIMTFKAKENSLRLQMREDGKMLDSSLSRHSLNSIQPSSLNSFYAAITEYVRLMTCLLVCFVFLLLKIDFFHIIYPDYGFFSLYSFHFFPTSPPVQIQPLSISHWNTNMLLRDTSMIDTI